MVARRKERLFHGPEHISAPASPSCMMRSTVMAKGYLRTEGNDVPCSGVRAQVLFLLNRHEHGARAFGNVLPQVVRSACSFPVELRSPGDELSNAFRSLLNELPDRVLLQRPSPALNVSSKWIPTSSHRSSQQQYRPGHTLCCSRSACLW